MSYALILAFFLSIGAFADSYTAIPICQKAELTGEWKMKAQNTVIDEPFPIEQYASQEISFDSGDTFHRVLRRSQGNDPSGGEYDRIISQALQDTKSSMPKTVTYRLDETGLLFIHRVGVPTPDEVYECRNVKSPEMLIGPSGKKMAIHKGDMLLAIRKTREGEVISLHQWQKKK